MKAIFAAGLIALSLAASGCVAVVPPPRRVEVIGRAPYRNAVWVPGHWVRGRYDWVWVRGYWR
ncbi:MAG TPA: hypothetical protein VG323_19970 [Thermoanaerobaculia bacterium]|nr:hypothetical protein [Thermoanaerobaculia bacterium]